MKKKIIIIFTSILVVLILILFAIEKVYYKKGQVYSVKIPMDSYCEEKQNSNSIAQACIYSGGLLIFGEFSSQGKISFKRELTNNNCFELNLADYKITPQSRCDINESIINELPLYLLDRYHKKCSPSGKFCIKNHVIGKIQKGGGFGLLSRSDRLYGIELFEIKNTTEDKIIYREARVKLGGSWDLSANTYWGDNDNFLIFEIDNKLNYLSFSAAGSDL